MIHVLPLVDVCAYAGDRKPDKRMSVLYARFDLSDVQWIRMTESCIHAFRRVLLGDALAGSGRPDDTHENKRLQNRQILLPPHNWSSNLLVSCDILGQSCGHKAKTIV